MNFIFLAAALVSSSTCSGPSGRSGADSEPMPLFENGRSAWVIAVPDAPSKYMSYAASELSGTLEKISGVKLATVKATAAPKLNVVKLSSDSREDLHDEFSVSMKPGVIELWGNTQRGTLFAVYALLREKFDARWYWPGESGEFLRKFSRYDVKSWQKKWRPFFDLREMSICSIWRHRHADTERWFPKVFLNCGIQTPSIREEIDYVRRTSGHHVSLPVTMKEREQIFAEHPEWFSLLNGKRDIKGIAGCWSNEGFYSYTVSNLVKRIRDNKAVLANFFVADIVPRCECENCTVDPDKSARWWKFYAKLIEGIRKEIPGMRFAGLPYQEYRAIPGIKVENLDHVDYCQYNRCYYHGLDDSKCEMNARSMKEFRGWAAQAPLGLYGYEFDVFTPAVYLPMWRVFSDEMRIFKQMNLKRVKTEYSVNLQRLAKAKKGPGLPRQNIGQLASRLAYYAWAMSAFDPDMDMDGLLDDFCSHVYGAGAEDMKAYHNMMADAWGGMKTHVTYFSNPARGAADRFLSVELEKAARLRLEAAASAAKGDARASSEIALDVGCLDVWAKFAKEAREGGELRNLREYSDDAFNRVSWINAKSKSGKPQKTRFKIYHGRKALHVLVECEEKENPAFNRGTAKNDAHNWSSTSIEFFIDAGDGAVRHVAVTPAGGVWDVKDGDRSWNTNAEVRPSFEADKWMLEITFPYEAFGGKPRSGDLWRFMVIRNACKGSKFSSCGWPINAHRDFSSAAKLVFK